MFIVEFNFFLFVHALQITRALGTAKTATASIGKFTPSLVCMFLILFVSIFIFCSRFVVVQPKEPEQRREKKRRVSSYSIVTSHLAGLSCCKTVVKWSKFLCKGEQAYVRVCRELGLHECIYHPSPYTHTHTSQFAPVVGDAAAERQKSLDLLSKLAKGKKVLDVKKATNAHLAAEQTR